MGEANKDLFRLTGFSEDFCYLSLIISGLFYFSGYGPLQRKEVVGIVIAMILIKFGFLLMYRQDCDLSLRNGGSRVIINITCMAVGLLVS